MFIASPEKIVPNNKCHCQMSPWRHCVLERIILKVIVDLRSNNNKSHCRPEVLIIKATVDLSLLY